MMNQYPEEPIEATGTVIFLLSNIGTKSEGVFPFLYVNRDTRYKLHLKGDDTFEEKGLSPYDGKRVKVSGVKIEDIKKSVAAGTLVADTVVILADEPVTPTETPIKNEADIVPAEGTDTPTGTPAQGGAESLPEKKQETPSPSATE